MGGSILTRACTAAILATVTAVLSSKGDDRPIPADPDDSILKSARMSMEELAALDRVEELRAALILQPDLANTPSANGNPLLFAAAGASQAAAVRLLLEHGADPQGENGIGANALHHCAWSGADPAMFDLLVEVGVDPEHRTVPRQWTSGGQSIGTPLDVAVAEGHADLVTALRERGFRFASEVDAIADGETLLEWHRAFLAEDLETAGRMLADNPALARSHTASRSAYRGDGNMHGFALYLASVHAGNPDMVRLLAESGGVPLRNGWDVGTPWPGLNVAVNEALLDAGFQVNMPSFGITDDESYLLALDRGVDVDAANPGSRFTYLHALSANLEAPLWRAYAAIRAGADVNLRTHSGLDDEPMIDMSPELGGQTPLHFAAVAGSVAMVRLLLRHGADPDLRTSSRRVDPEKRTAWPHDGFLWWARDPHRIHYEPYAGETPVDLARRFGHQVCVALLEAASTP